jgi:hypothetical protein
MRVIYSKSWLLILPASIKVGWRVVLVTNATTYWSGLPMMKKSGYNNAILSQCYKTFSPSSTEEKHKQECLFLASLIVRTEFIQL